ncbi:hypothetical protein REPUB_Repub02eG0037400 [Reevesia pubescens]
MEVRRPLKSDDKLKHRPLTPFRFLRGLICLVVFLSTAFMLLVYLGPGAVLSRFFSLHYSRKATSFFFGLWLSLWPFLFEKINRTKVVFSGDNVPREERVLLIVNHRTEVDWMYLWDLAMRQGCLGYINEEKCRKNQKFAAEVGLPVLTNVLLPKTRGFCLCLETLRDSLDAVYDLSVAYKHQCPFFLDNVFGVDPSEVHIHIRRIPVKEIPESNEEAAAWLIDTFKLKDQLLSDFKSQGHFPNQRTEEQLSTSKSLLNFTVIISLTTICTYLTFSSMLYMVYVILACLCLAYTTHYNIRPMPVLSSVKLHSPSKGTRDE